MGTNDESLFLAVNNDSTSKVEKRSINKEKISNVEELIKASKLILCMGLIHYAAS